MARGRLCESPRSSELQGDGRGRQASGRQAALLALLTSARYLPIEERVPERGRHERRFPRERGYTQPPSYSLEWSFPAATRPDGVVRSSRARRCRLRVIRQRVEADEPKESTTTAPAPAKAPAKPAAPDASPYVLGFGDLNALSFPAGDPGELAVVSTGAQDELSDAVTIIVRNNTSDPIGRIEATGTARDAAGALVGSGSSQGFKPVVVAPGEIAYGYVYFEGGFPKGSTLKFDVTGEEVGTYFRPITITEINNTGDAISVVSRTTPALTSPGRSARTCSASQLTAPRSAPRADSPSSPTSPTVPPARSRSTCMATSARSGSLRPPATAPPDPTHPGPRQRPSPDPSRCPRTPD